MRAEEKAALTGQRVRVVFSTNAPASMAQGFHYAGQKIQPGVPAEMNAYEAGRLVFDYDGLVTVITGDAPAIAPPLPARADRLARVAHEKAAMFGRSPADALRDLPVVPESLLKTLRTRKAVEAVAQGDADGHLPATALWARLSGRDALMAALIARADFLGGLS